MEKHIVQPENAKTFLSWIRNRGGIAVWPSVDLSNPGASWSTPALQEDGTPYRKPYWQAADKPERIITDIADVVVVVDKEVKRFHVAVHAGSNGFKIKCSDASSAKIRKAIEKAGKDAYHVFDYDTQECVIMAPESQVSMAEWENSNS